jgi:hypothetical protein
MKFPTDIQMNYIRERALAPVPESLNMLFLSVEEAWMLMEFLDEVQEAIWLDYGLDIADYLDSLEYRESHWERRYAAEEEADGSEPSGTSDAIDF